jgi:hypothetical protein
MAGSADTPRRRDAGGTRADNDHVESGSGRRGCGTGSPRHKRRRCGEERSSI